VDQVVVPAKYYFQVAELHVKHFDDCFRSLLLFGGLLHGASDCEVLALVREFNFKGALLVSVKLPNLEVRQLTW